MTNPPQMDARAKRLTESVTAILKEFIKESDRAAVILIAARLDYLLAELLARFMVPNVGSSDELLGVERPLGTFSARIHAAYRLRLIDADFARALHIFRRLRNSFAHETSGGTLNEGPHRDRVREISGPLSKCPEFNKMGDSEFFKGKTRIAAEFYSVGAILIARLEVASHDVEQTQGEAVPLLPPGWSLSKGIDAQGAGQIGTTNSSSGASAKE